MRLIDCLRCRPAEEKYGCSLLSPWHTRPIRPPTIQTTRMPSASELPVGIPVSSWPVFQIGDLTSPNAPAVYGILQPGPNVDGGVPYVRPSEIDLDQIDVVNLRRTSQTIAGRYQRSSLEGGDVILSIVGTIGKVAVVPKELSGANITQSSVRIRVRRELIIPDFLAWFLRSPAATQQFDSYKLGSAVQRLNVAHVRAILVPVPPIEVQFALISKLEDRLARLAAAVHLLDTAQRDLQRYQSSVFKTACAGRLVDREAELADAERRSFVDAPTSVAASQRPPRPARWKSRNRNIIPGHSALAVGNPQSDLPTGWTWVSLSEIAQMESGHTPSRSNPLWWNGDIPWLGLPDAKSHDGSVIHQTSQHTNSTGLANSAARLLPAGTVCLSRTAAVGYVVILGQPMATSQDFVNWIPNESLASRWLQIVLMADREALRRFGKGSIHTTIYFPELLSFYIALPPFREQIRIVAEVDRRISLINRARATLNKSSLHAAHLRKAILYQAFGGNELIRISPAVGSKSDELDTRQMDRELTMRDHRKRKSVMTRPIIDVLQENSAGVSVEDLFISSGYFEAANPDAFYQELSSLRDQIEELRPSDTRGWPNHSRILLKPKVDRK